MIRKNRTGSHVSMIVSFAVFITFLVFLFIILRPSLVVDEEKFALDNSGALFIEYLSSNLTTASINVNSGVTITGSCLQFNGLTNASGIITTGDSLIVKNSNGDLLNYHWQTNDLEVENNGVNRFFKIYQSDIIGLLGIDQSNCAIIEENQYTLGLTKTEKRIFVKNITNAVNLYRTNYALLKQKIGISSGEFGFDFTYDNGTILSVGDNNQKTNTFAKKFLVNYLDASLNSNAGSITIKIW